MSNITYVRKSDHLVRHVAIYANYIALKVSLCNMIMAACLKYFEVLFKIFVFLLLSLLSEATRWIETKVSCHFVVFVTRFENNLMTVFIIALISLFTIPFIISPTYHKFDSLYLFTCFFFKFNFIPSFYSDLKCYLFIAIPASIGLCYMRVV